MVELKRVALRFSLNSGLTRDMVRGVIAYTQKHGPWEIDIRSSEPIAFTDWDELKTWKGDGIIAPIYEPAQIRMLQKKNIPVVNVADSIGDMSFPSITFDNLATGKMAAEYLLAYKLDRFAFIGPKKYGYSLKRCKAFAETIAQHGGSCTKCWIKPVTSAAHKILDDSWVAQGHYLAALQQLQPPVGILAANDQVGYGILRAARQLGLRSPEDICLLSVDNDEILCNLAHPNLSSISLAAEQFGYKAAAMLDAQMRGRPLQEPCIIIPPDKIITRNSSDFIHHDNRYVAEALRYIRNHAGRFIDVSDVMSVVPISRRSLERLFQDQIGHGVYKEIARCHIERAKELLTQTDWSISRIARESGYNSTNRFEVAFRNETTVGAMHYRKSMAQQTVKKADRKSRR
jgi:LacI family transcriptional regulator